MKTDEVQQLIKALLRSLRQLVSLLEKIQKGEII